MKDFIAIEITTANKNRYSICAISMVFVENGEIIDSIHQLINPEEPFAEESCRIHGIREGDVKDAPTFQHFYSSQAHKIENKIMVAHYMGFHGHAIRDTLLKYNTIPVNCQFICTYQLSRRLLLGQEDFSLATLCRHFGIHLSNLQPGLENAWACAELLKKLCHEFNLHDLHAIYSRTNIKPGESSLGTFNSSVISHTRKKSPLQDEVNQAIKGKNVVFTGKLTGFFRKEAAAMVVNNGGTPQGAVNKETDYLVVGNYHQVMKSGQKSSKLKRAERMIEEGNKIEIISEEEFLHFINKKHL